VKTYFRPDDATLKSRAKPDDFKRQRLETPSV